jgi:hypothetical protein
MQNLKEEMLIMRNNNNVPVADVRVGFVEEEGVGKDQMHVALELGQHFVLAVLELLLYTCVA